MLRSVSRLPVLVPIMIFLLPGSAECRPQSATPESLSPPILRANTPVTLRLKKDLYKKDAKPGQPVEFEVGVDVIVNGQVSIQSGATVSGSIREINKTGKGPANVLIDLGPTQTVSGEVVRLVGPGTTTDGASLGRPALKDVGGMVAYGPEMIPLLPVVVPVLAVMQLFPGKKVLLHKGVECGWFVVVGHSYIIAYAPGAELCGGVWVVAHVAENVALDAAKLKAAQTQFRESVRAVAMYSCLSYKAGAPAQDRDLDGAIKGCEQALASEPDSLYLPYLHLQIARLFQEKGDFVHALPEYRTVVQLDPKDESFREVLVTALEDSGDLDSALAESKEAIRIWADKPYFHYLLGKLLVKKNDPDGAIAELQSVLKQERNHDWRASCALGSAYELKGDLKAALSQYRTRTACGVLMDDQECRECRAAYERLRLQLKK